MSAEFKRQVLQWDGITVAMKETSGMIGKSDLTSYKMIEVVMQTSETVSTIKSTEILVKYSTVPIQRHTLNRWPITQPR